MGRRLPRPSWAVPEQGHWHTSKKTLMEPRRSPEACSMCRSRRVKCGGVAPCSACTRRGEACVFEKIEMKPNPVKAMKRVLSPPPPAPTPQSLEEENIALQRRVQELEGGGEAEGGRARLKLQRLPAGAAAHEAAVFARQFNFSRARALHPVLQLLPQESEFVDIFYEKIAAKISMFDSPIPEFDDFLASVMFSSSLAGGEAAPVVSVDTTGAFVMSLCGIMAFGAWVKGMYVLSGEYLRRAGGMVQDVLLHPDIHGVRALMLLCEMHLHLMHKLAFHSFIQLAADVVAQLERRPGGFVLTDPSDVSVAIRVRFYNQVMNVRVKHASVNLAELGMLMQPNPTVPMKASDTVPRVLPFEQLKVSAAVTLASTHRLNVFTEEWKTFAQTIVMFVDNYFSQAAAEGRVLPWQQRGALCAFRCIYCLKTGDRPGSIAWGLKAADAFGCADPDALLDLSVIDAAVHTMEALRRQGHVSEIVALRSLLMYQTKMFPIAAYIVAKNSTRPDFLLPFESAVMPFPPGLYLRKHRPGQLPSPSPASATEVEFPADGISWDGTHATGSEAAACEDDANLLGLGWEMDLELTEAEMDVLFESIQGPVNLALLGSAASKQ